MTQQFQGRSEEYIEQIESEWGLKFGRVFQESHKTHSSDFKNADAPFFDYLDVLENYYHGSWWIPKNKSELEFIWNVQRLIRGYQAQYPLTGSYSYTDVLTSCIDMFKNPEKQSKIKNIREMDHYSNWGEWEILAPSYNKKEYSTKLSDDSLVGEVTNYLEIMLTYEEKTIEVAWPIYLEFCERLIEDLDVPPPDELPGYMPFRHFLYRIEEDFPLSCLNVGGLVYGKAQKVAASILKDTQNERTEMFKKLNEEAA